MQSRPPTDAASTHPDDRLIAYLRQAVDIALEEVARRYPVLPHWSSTPEKA